MENSKQVFTLLDKVLEDYSCYNPFFNFLIPEAGAKPVEPYLHQVEVASRLLFRKPIRVLIADEIGLGKTITALAMLRKLRKTGKAKRALILVPRILINQWIRELRRIGIVRIHRIERNTIKDLERRQFPEGCYIASIDLVKRDEPPYRYFSKVKQIPWDIVIIDEAHRLGIGTERLQKIGQVIGKPDMNVLMLTATPHRGIPQDYLARLTVLDPYLVKGEYLNNREFYALTHNVTVFRRRKEEVNKIYEKRDIFPECDFNALVVQATKEEEQFQKRLMNFMRTKIIDYYERMQEPPRAIGLLMTIIFKRATSSPYAAMKTLENIIRKRAVILSSATPEEIEARLNQKVGSIADSVFGFGFDDYGEEDLELEPDEQVNRFAEECSVFLNEREMKEITTLYELAKKIQRKDSRLNAVTEYVKHHIEQGSKIVLFSEFKDTVRYVYDKLTDEIGQEAIVKLTSEESRKEEKLKKLRRRFEKNPKCKVLVASDVASEGLNLQVANVLINYEIAWSPVKLEQRVGRVWRLGQTKKVNVYTILLTAEIDSDALDIVYRKLLELDKATKARPLVGEYVLVLDMREKTDTSKLPLVELSKGKRKIKATEYGLINTYVRGGREALSELVDKILTTLKNLNNELRRNSVFPQVDPLLLETLINRSTGFKNISEIENSLKNLVKTMIPLAKQYTSIIYDPEKELIILGSSAPQTIDKHYKCFAILNAIIQKSPKKVTGIPCIVANGNEIEDLYLIEAQVLHNKDIIYSEPIGVLVKEEKPVEILRGTQLIKYLSDALQNITAIPTEHTTNDPPEKAKTRTKRLVEDVIRYISSDYLRYVHTLNQKGWRDRDKTWLPKPELISVKVNHLMGIIRRITENKTKAPRAKPIVRKITEKQAMKRALQYEKENGREAIDVSEFEHYDIKSNDPKTGEIRYIEVKGHEGRAFVVELTEDEYKEAKKRRGTYWLYLVYNVGKEKPEILAIKDPLNNMKVKTITERRYMLSL